MILNLRRRYMMIIIVGSILQELHQLARFYIEFWHSFRIEHRRRRNTVQVLSPHLIQSNNTLLIKYIIKFKANRPIIIQWTIWLKVWYIKTADIILMSARELLLSFLLFNTYLYKNPNKIESISNERVKIWEGSMFPFEIIVSFIHE